MRLYHGSPISDLKALKAGEAFRQGQGIYLTDSINQARYYGREGGVVYEVLLSNYRLLDLSSEKEVTEVFGIWRKDPMVGPELELLILGASELPKVLNLINHDEAVLYQLSQYNLFKVKSLGFRGSFNYIAKEGVTIEILSTIAT